MGASHLPHAPAPQARPVVVGMPQYVSVTLSILIFGLVLLAFSHAGFAVMAGVSHGMTP